MDGFRELNVAEMRQVEGGWNPFKKVWCGIKKGFQKVFPVAVKVGKFLGEIFRPWPGPGSGPTVPVPR